MDYGKQNGSNIAQLFKSDFSYICLSFKGQEWPINFLCLILEHYNQWLFKMNVIHSPTADEGLSPHQYKQC